MVIVTASAARGGERGTSVVGVMLTVVSMMIAKEIMEGVGEEEREGVSNTDTPGATLHKNLQQYSVTACLTGYWNFGEWFN